MKKTLFNNQIKTNTIIVVKSTSQAIFESQSKILSNILKKCNFKDNNIPSFQFDCGIKEANKTLLLATAQWSGDLHFTLSAVHFISLLYTGYTYQTRFLIVYFADPIR